ncbi:MAG: TonB-dependent receptor, partial [Tannerellaceae bacterium]|nr:TonB-dependent receptor [Tannerellaceae bacterium]
ITELYGDGNERDLSNSWFIGEPVSAQYDYIVDGVWQEKDLFERAIMSGYYPGMYRLQDLNGDNSIDATNDRTIVGYSAPNYRFGINNSFTYKGFSLDFFINSIQGGDGYYKSNVFDIIVPGSGDYAIRV